VGASDEHPITITLEFTVALDKAVQKRLDDAIQRAKKEMARGS
jgi:hypothetical protein